MKKLLESFKQKVNEIGTGFTEQDLPWVERGQPAVILTAENPHGEPLPPSENLKLNRALEQDLTEQGFDYIPQKGKYGGNPEDSFIVFGMTEEYADMLARKYEQRSIIFANQNQYEMRYTDGSPSDFASSIKFFSEQPKDYFSLLQNWKGKGDFYYSIEF